MARARFLAAAQDHRPGKEETVYGPSHETDFDETDTDFVMECWLAGKVEILDTTGLPVKLRQGPQPPEQPPA